MSSPRHPAMVRSRFDAARVGRALEQVGGVRSLPFGDTTLYALERSENPPTLAFPRERSLVFGGKHEAPTGQREGDGHEVARPGLLRVLGEVLAGVDFWLVGDERLRAEVILSCIEAPEPGWRLSPLKSVVLSGTLGGAITANVVLEASDSASARELGGGLRGLIDLGAVRALEPGLRNLLTSIGVFVDGRQVRLEATIEYAWLDPLGERRDAVAGPVPATGLFDSARPRPPSGACP